MLKKRATNINKTYRVNSVLSSYLEELSSMLHCSQSELVNVAMINLIEDNIAWFGNRKEEVKAGLAMANNLYVTADEQSYCIDEEEER